MKFNRMGLGGSRCNRCESMKVYEQCYGPTHIRAARETKEQLLPGTNFANGSFCCRVHRSMARWIL